MCPGDPPSARDLDDDEWELVELARRTIEDNADAGLGEDGLHTVGAAVRVADGRVFVGVNLYHFTGGPCAELVALGAARAGGGREVTAVGVGRLGVMAPCGRDRQVLSDCYPGARVVVAAPDGPRSVACVDLLPGPQPAPSAVVRRAVG